MCTIYIVGCGVVIAVFSCAADAEGTHDVVDVGECVDVCYGWVSGLTGLHLPPVIIVIKLLTVIIITVSLYILYNLVT